MEIDLHDKNVNEAINYFMTKYNEILSKGFKGEISVIHGYGSSGVGGKIKKRFKEFSEAYTSYFNVSYNNNIGITIVKPIKQLPNYDFLFENELLNSNLSPATKKSHQSTLNRLNEFNNSIDFSAVNFEFLHDFERFLRSDKCDIIRKNLAPQKLSQNTIHKYFKNIKT